MNALMQLVVALDEEGVVPRLDTLGAMEVLDGLFKLEKKGWQFIPPPEESEPG